MLKQASKLPKKCESYNTAKFHLESTSSDLPLALLTHSPDALLHAYQYLNGRVSYLQNTRKDTIIAILVTHDHIQYITRSTIEEVYGDD